jgi:hypothetical protein
MPFAPVIVLAAVEGPGLDVVIWLAAGAFWLISQIVAARKAKEKKDRAASRPPPAGAPGASPAADELAEIFKRLGATVPGTPPAPPPAPRPVAPPTAALRPRPPPAPRQAMKIPPRPPPAPARQAPRVQPEIARRLARAKREAAEAARLVEAEQQALNAIVPGVQSRAGETRALDTATRHTGAILPRLYAMSMRLANLPALPMPGLDRTHHTQTPLRTRLHGRREVREALIAQAFLQPPKSFSV